MTLNAFFEIIEGNHFEKEEMQWKKPTALRLADYCPLFNTPERGT